MANHTKSLHQKKEDFTKDLADANSKLERMQVHIGDLKRMIETQELSPHDVIKLDTESKGAMEAMQRLQAVKETREKDLLESEEALHKHALVCESIMDSLNAKLGDLHSFGAFAETFQSYKFVLTKECLLDSDPIRAFGVDYQGSLTPAMYEASHNLAERTTGARKETQLALDRLDENASAKEEALSVKQILVEKITKCTESMQSEQEAHDARMAIREREIDALAHKVEARRDPMALEEQMAIMERELAELEALRNKHDAENVQKKKAVMEEIELACEHMEEHAQYINGKVKELGKYRAAKMAKAVKVVSPTDQCACAP